MAVTGTTLERVTLITRDARRLAAFYSAAFGFSITGEDTGQVRLALGRQTVELHMPSSPGGPCPNAPGWSPLFQHVAIVVSDMPAAVAQLRAQSGWRPISRDGPQKLPASSGGVTAFKFRDPENHPLEFLAFPLDTVPPDWRGVMAEGPCLGFDHSAISVTDTARSVAFYEKLGLSVSARSLNTGPAQARLDGIDDPALEVTGLAPGGRATPHVELLCYRGHYPRDTTHAAVNDGAASRLVFDMNTAAWTALLSNAAFGAVKQPDDSLLLRDPDGHVVQIFHR